MPLKPDTPAMTVVLALLTALGPLSTDMYLPSLPAIRADLGATTAGTQLTLSAFLLGFAVGQFVYGPVSDRIGRRPVLLFGLALFTLASLACTVAPSIETLVSARFVQQSEPRVRSCSAGPSCAISTRVHEQGESCRA
jgi:DHA1 family bicyclomycin/chloramphenicol resistance-like MFS transporter